jgi:tellurite resistance protein TerC
VALALVFNGGVWHFAGSRKALEFFTGYLIEKSLSIDNIFVIVLLFSYFKVPQEYQHRVLFWGILGALLMRGILIAVGAALMAKFVWIIYVFGAFLVFTGIRMALQKEHGVDPHKNPIVRWFENLFAVTPNYYGQSFFVRLNGVAHATPLFVVLLMVEFTDLIFAVDSIPAIFAITQDPFIVYTSNVFAILGLRSLYFALAGVIHKFHYLKIGLAIVLVFVGIKMLLAHSAYKIPTPIALGVVGLILAGAVVLSLVNPPKETDQK